MHLHILGICGTFMGGIARLAIEAGHTVSGADRAAYPPMSDQLEALAIDVVLGFDKPLPDADLIIVGNSMTRGMPVIEELMRSDRAYISGPAWLHQEVLRGRHVIAVAGTHGKTTTSSIIAWILHVIGCEAGHESLRNPGFLIGGVPGNFDVSARCGNGPFVVEADEYDTAFFDKRAKFVHYPARTLILHNLEYDHADIYPDVDAIVRQFHHAVRLVPDDGTVLRGANEPHIDQALAAGCWSAVKAYGVLGLGQQDTGAEQPHWQAKLTRADGTCFQVLEAGSQAATVTWNIPGEHNVQNALAAIAACQTIGITPDQCARALATFVLPARRLELRHVANGTTILLDFAHHPTAIAATLKTLRTRYDGRVLLVVEARSNTMRTGVHGDALGATMQLADAAWLLGDLSFDYERLGIHSFADADDVSEEIAAAAAPGDVVILMSNGNLTALADHIAARITNRHE